MKRLDRSRCLRILATPLFALAMTGCYAAMSTSTDAKTTHDSMSSSSSLRFKVHDFDVYCYNTVRCKVIYNHSNLSPSDAEDEPSPPPASADYKDHWSHASYLGIRNFPEPAEVSWTSLDGVAHEAKVDIGAIFKDERVLYHVPDSEIPEGSFNGEPDIFLEVNDRTINVYMQAFISTKTEQIPGNKHSNFRNDLVLAWSHTY
jgi:hypothetical protein